MKQLIQLSLVLFILIHSTHLSAVNTVLPINDCGLALEKNEIKPVKQKKLGFFKKLVLKSYIKKLNKLGILQVTDEKPNKGEFEKTAELGIWLGITSFVLFFVGFFAPIIFIAAGIFALAADILCIRVLSKTRNNKDIYYKARRQSVVGLVFALLTGVIPLLALIIVLVSLS